MKLIKSHFLLFIMFTFTCTEVFSQSWQLVWSDEFENGISSDWVFETGNGVSGWGNNELEYYRSENATVQNGQLVITAKREDYGGFRYTSARMKTQGKKSWKYGKIEARIAMPAFQGAWPAFWMLGDNINSVGWPACGEIDIMEHVNTGTSVVGTIHWADNSGGHAEYGGSTNTSVTSYHVYGIEWDASEIRWYVDGVQYHVASILDGVNGTSEFHDNFFILLNLAIGGNWPGFTIDESALPASMYVDYVRVYQGDGGGTDPVADVIEAENYSSMSGIDVESTTDDGGGQNIGWIDTGDWVAYNNITFPTSGTYTIEYRVASESGGGQLSLDLNAGSTVLGTISIPSTGGWQNWTTVSQTVNVSAGTYNLGIYAVSGGWNLNWFKISSATPSWEGITVQAESYSNMLGVDTETTYDETGGLNVGWIDTGDWMAYSSIEIPSSGNYTVEYRVASESGGGRLSLDLNAGSTVLGAIDIPSTGGWQNWTTISHSTYIPAGTYDFGIYAVSGGWNINWWRIVGNSNSRTTESIVSEVFFENSSELLIYPNPVENSLHMRSPISLNEGYARIINMEGKTVLKTDIESDEIDVDNLPAGVYVIHISKNNQNFLQRFIKK